jgi:hypothetical protein
MECNGAIVHFQWYMRGDGVQFLLSLLNGDTRTELADSIEEVIATVLQHLSGGLQREPHALLKIGPIDSGKRNALGITPTTVRELPPIFTDCPTMLGSA